MGRDIMMEEECVGKGRIQGQVRENAHEAARCLRESMRSDDLPDPEGYA